MSPEAEIGKIVSQLLDAVVDMDESPKMILHEPYRTIMNRISREFKEELAALANEEADTNE